MSVDRGAYRFFRRHGGSRVGHNAEDALFHARAEEQLRAAVDLGVAEITWLEEEGWSYDDLGDVTPPEEMQALFHHGEWTGPFVCLLDTGDAHAALGMIVLGPGSTGGDPYARVVEAELAGGLQDELRQSIGDALDARRGPEWWEVVAV